eukprot:11937188-Alexandrium_andersonii.AAC.1
MRASPGPAKSSAEQTFASAPAGASAARLRDVRQPSSGKERSAQRLAHEVPVGAGVAEPRWVSGR